MKNFLLALLLSALSAATFAQSAIQKSSFTIGLGPSFPIGDFASKNAGDDRAGLAATGFHVNLGYQYQFSQYVGAILLLNGRTHGIAKDALRISVPDGSGASASASATTWKMGSILAGLSQSFPLTNSKAFAIEFREAAGVQFTSSPEINVNYNIPGVGSAAGNQDAQSGTSFGLLLGMGFKYQLSDKLGLKLYGDFNGSNAHFKAFTVTTGDVITIVPASKQNTGTIDVGVGLTVGF